MNSNPKNKKGLSNPCLAPFSETRSKTLSFFANLSRSVMHGSSGVRSSSLPVIIKRGVCVCISASNVKPQYG